MSLRKALGAPATVSYATQSSSLLPFLYCTRTLLQQSHRTGSSQWGRASPPFRQFTCLHKTHAQAYKTRRDHNVPFEGDPYTQPDVSFGNPNPQSSKRSTITKTEKAVFDRIFKDLSQPPPSPLSSQQDAEVEDIDAEAEVSPEVDNLERSFNLNEDLNAIFDAAIRELRLREEAATLAPSHKHHPQYEYLPQERAIDSVIATDAGWRTFKRPLRLSMGSSITLSSGMVTKSTQLRLEKAAEKHNDVVSRLLERASTDVEIWGVLQREVFSVVSELNEKIEEDKRGRRKEMEVEEAKERSKKMVGEGEGEEIGKHLVKRKRESNVKKEEIIEREVSMGLATNELFYILQENYAEYLLRALRLLRSHHPTSNYALYLLPTIKRLGPISYVLGTSPGLYNELLFLKWTEYSDLHGMADLLQEMMDKGIETNSVTMVLLARLRRLRRYGRVGKMGPVVQHYWHMRGTLEGYRRIVGLEARAKEEEFQREERESMTARRENLAELE
ncbi:hypothetical protein JMJ35_000456 [Cladonia borealis]|uniref:Mtf2-like C-terminal domain-containing protein n=1 Tax=Cladonia borealis TaxID=184061 RepID=A0AA39UF70_9LECA|nr:hypothetical protein JMJ35_000456 [Cladonia borealis]